MEARNAHRPEDLAPLIEQLASDPQLVGYRSPLARKQSQRFVVLPASEAISLF